MTTLERAPGAPLPTPTPDPARVALALRVLDGAIRPGALSNADTLGVWLTAIEGAAGYLEYSASALSSDLPPTPDDLAGVGALIKFAARICGRLADAVAEGAA